MAFDITSFKDYVPLVTAIFGGVGVKLLEKVMSKRSETFNESASLREELREQIQTLREEIETWKRQADEWKTEADTWRKEYWKQIEYNIQQKSKYEADLGSLRNEIELLKSKLLPDSETI
jgi:chromosome segregation ATPase